VAEGPRSTANGHGDHLVLAASHPHRLWRWAAFDPPLRSPGGRGCCPRQVSCRACGLVLGTTEDPIDALLVAWRHGRAERTRTKVTTAKI
jgi:hypothetical protein